MKRVLFICMGNICRSPAAETIFRKMVREAGLKDEFEIDSAGTIGAHQGNPPDSRMIAHLEERGYQPGGLARKLMPSDLVNFDLLLTMDEENLHDTLRLDTGSKYRHKVKPFVQFLENHDVPRIPDPYYGGDAGFVHVIDLLEDGCAALLKELADK